MLSTACLSRVSKRGGDEVSDSMIGSGSFELKISARSSGLLGCGVARRTQTTQYGLSKEYTLNDMGTPNMI